jgi:hypothetical protein
MQLPPHISPEENQREHFVGEVPEQNTSNKTRFMPPILSGAHFGRGAGF